MKKGNKSTKGKKNWRKNIDTTEIDKKDIKDKEQKRVEKNFEALKDSDLFEIDVEPAKGVKEKFLHKKTERPTASRNEERLVKRIVKAELEKQNLDESKGNNEKGLWDDEKPSQPSISFPKKQTDPLKYPKIPLPHPGQSYNPSKDDLSNLLNKVVELNKKPENMEKILKPEIEVEAKQFDSEEEEELDLLDFKISNNPPVDDYTQRKTKTQRNKAIRKRLSIIKEAQQTKLKKEKKHVLTVKGLKRFEKEKEKILKEEKEKKLKKLIEKKRQEELIKIGVIEE
jgi:hypothetical protein